MTRPPRAKPGRGDPVMEIERQDKNRPARRRLPRSPTTARSATRDRGPRLAFLIIGFTPIATLALSLVELVPLHVGGPIFVTTACIVAVPLGLIHPHHGRAALRGLGSGLMAVLVYDCTRLPFVIWGGWPDFIPSIGVWLFDDPDVHWSIGYLWRYLGNGGGMGMAFAMVVTFAGPSLDPRATGPAFGVVVWSGLLITMAVAPDGQDKLFVLTPLTVTLSLIGHLVYGAVLGLDGHRHRHTLRHRQPEPYPIG